MDYKIVYELWKKEKENKDLQKIPSDFLGQLSDYVKFLKEQQRMLDEKSVRAKLLRAEYDRARQLITELIRVRSDKILERIRVGDMPTDVCTEEMMLYRGFVSVIGDYDEAQKRVMEGMDLEARKTRRGRVLVRVLQSVPAFVGSDMKRYGPFMREDLASIPVENAEILDRKGIVVKVRLNENT